MSIETIYKKNEYGYLNQIYPHSIITRNSKYQMNNNIKCDMCQTIPVLYKIKKSNQSNYYICYKCSKSETLINYHFGPYQYEIFKTQNDPYEYEE